MKDVSGEARLEILSRLYKAGARRETPPLPPLASPPPRPAHLVVEQFAEYAAEYRARVRGCTRDELPATLSELLQGQQVIVPPGLPADFLNAGVHAVPDHGQDHRTLGGFGAVLTTCAVAIAETGTVVLDHGPGQGRRALTLIPDHHVCVVEESQVVDGMAQAVAALGPAIRAGRPLTFISGPSATSDIELSRVEGVHGPRQLDIVLVSAGGWPERAADLQPLS